MICFLVRFERLELVGVYSNIMPVDVELGVGVFILRDAPTQVLLGHLLYQRILSFYIENKIEPERGNSYTTNSY